MKIIIGKKPLLEEELKNISRELGEYSRGGSTQGNEHLPDPATKDGYRALVVARGLLGIALNVLYTPNHYQEELRNYIKGALTDELLPYGLRVEEFRVNNSGRGGDGAAVE